MSFTKINDAKLLDPVPYPLWDPQGNMSAIYTPEQAATVCNRMGAWCTGYYSDKSKKKFHLTKGNKWKTKKDYTSWAKFPDRMSQSKSKKENHSDNSLKKVTKKFPSDADLKQVAKSIIFNTDLSKTTKRMVISNVSDYFGGIDLTEKKQFLKSVIKSELEQRRLIEENPRLHFARHNSRNNGQLNEKKSKKSVINRKNTIKKAKMNNPSGPPSLPPPKISRENEDVNNSEVSVNSSIGIDEIHKSLSKINNLYSKIDIKPKSFDLVVGNVQSGKTKVIISHVFKSLQQDPNMIVFIITRVSLADSLQMRDRISIFNKENIHNPRYFINAEDINKIKPRDIPEKRVMVSLGNKTRLQKCLDLINHEKITKFCICIDEQDLVASDTTKAEGVLSNILKHEKMHHILAVTATPLATYMSFNKKPHVNRIFKLEKPLNYVGLLEDKVSNPKLKFMEAAPVNRSRRTYDEATDLSNITRMLSACDIVRPFCISLILSAVKNDDQKDLIIKVIQRHPDWVGLVYNQNNVEIIGSQNIDSTGRVIKQIVVKDGPDPENPESSEEKGSLSRALTILRTKGIKNIVMAAGKKADRGISFTDSAFKYHLTSIYIRQSEKITLHCESLIQKLRILGIYQDEFTPRMKDIPLLLWTTSKLYSNLKRCQLITDEYTDKLAETTNIKSTIDDMNSIFQEIVKIQEDVPDVPLSKKRYQELVNWKPYEEVLNQASEIDGISYNRYTRGWHLGYMGSNSIRKPHFELCNNRCEFYEEQVDFIINKLHERMPEKWPLDMSRRHQLTWYIPNIPKSDFIVEDGGASGYKNETLIDEYVSSIDLQTSSRQFQQMENQGLNIKDIFPNKKKYRKSYKEDAYDYIGNPYEQIVREDIRRKDGKKRTTDTYEDRSENYYHYKKSPLRIRYDYPLPNPDEIAGTVPRENCPLVIDIKYPVNFTLGNAKIDSGINTGDIIWWHNLYGVVFVDRVHPDSINDYKEWADKSKLILQLKDTESPSLRPNTNISSRTSARKGGLDLDLEMIRLLELHKQFKGMSSNDSHKYFRENPKKLAEYHQLRNKRWPDSLNPALELIDTLRGALKVINTWKIIDMGCGNAVIANELKELDIKSIDHIKLNSKVSVANMKDTKEPTNYYSIVIFCLSLSWGGEEEDYIKEAERICKSDPPGGYIWIIEPIKRKEKLEELISKFSNIKIKETIIIKGSEGKDKFIWFKLKHLIIPVLADI